MQFTKKYTLVSVRETPGENKQASGGGAFTSIKQVLDKMAQRVGSSLSEDRLKDGVIFYLGNRPKDRQGRLDWDKGVDRVSTLCRERLASCSVNVIIGRTGNQIEISRKK